jgi:hypothetical protein
MGDSKRNNILREEFDVMGELPLRTVSRSLVSSATVYSYMCVCRYFDEITS